MKIDLSGTTAIVTGSTGGIGLAIARGLAGAGASVVVNGRTQTKADATAAAIVKAIPAAKVRGVGADVSTAAGCARLVEAAPDVDILINNAGHLRAERASSIFPMRIGAASSTSM